MRLVLITLLFFSPAVFGAETILQKVEREEVYTVPDGDAEMARAFKRARDGLEAFLAIADAPPTGASGFAVKVGISEGNTTEYFWITPFTHSKNTFSGEINNSPQTVSGVVLGERIQFSRDEIVDWLYVENGRMVGNFTTCAILTREPEEARQEFKAAYGLECDA